MKPIFCDNCGAKLHEGDKYCPNCGKAVSNMAVGTEQTKSNSNVNKKTKSTVNHLKITSSKVFMKKIHNLKGTKWFWLVLVLIVIGISWYAHSSNNNTSSGFTGLGLTENSKVKKMTKESGITKYGQVSYDFDRKTITLNLSEYGEGKYGLEIARGWMKDNFANPHSKLESEIYNLASNLSSKLSDGEDWSIFISYRGTNILCRRGIHLTSYRDTDRYKDASDDYEDEQDAADGHISLDSTHAEIIERVFTPIARGDDQNDSDD